MTANLCKTATPVTVGFGPLLDPNVAGAADRGYCSSTTTFVATSADRFDMDRSDKRHDPALPSKKECEARHSPSSPLAVATG